MKEKGFRGTCVCCQNAHCIEISLYLLLKLQPYLKFMNNPNHIKTNMIKKATHIKKQNRKKKSVGIKKS